MNAEIEKNIKKFFKREREFKRVYTKEECDAILAFRKDDPKKYDMFLNATNSEEVNMANYFTIVYIKNKNPHNGKNQTKGYVKKCMPVKKISN